MKEVVSSPALVAYCGLYCGACGSYLRERCPGCHENEKAKWCRVRICCIENQYLSCAECKELDNPKDCKKFENMFARLASLIFRSDRHACIRQIEELGIQGHADNMTEHRRQTIKR